MTLRIQKATESERVVLRLAGRIRVDQIPALRALLRSAAPNHGLILDLTDVKLVDRDAVQFLVQSEAQGASLRNCSAFIREWILQERNAMRRAHTEGSQVSEE